MKHCFNKCGLEIYWISVLEVIKKQVKNNYLHDPEQNIITVNQFNPFTKVHTKKNYSEKSVIFPNKLLNLNRCKMLDSSITDPPTLSVMRNNSKFPMKFIALDAEVTKALSKTMNFKITEVASEKEDWGHYDINPNEITSATQKLTNKEIQFSTNIGQRIAGTEKVLQFSRVLDYFCYMPVVSMIETKT